MMESGGSHTGEACGRKMEVVERSLWWPRGDSERFSAEKQCSKAGWFRLTIREAL